jgi:hypothetical protein
MGNEAEDKWEVYRCEAEAEGSQRTGPGGGDEDPLGILSSRSSGRQIIRGRTHSAVQTGQNCVLGGRQEVSNFQTTSRGQGAKWR